MTKKRKRLVHFVRGMDCWIYEIWPAQDSFQRACWRYQEADDVMSTVWTGRLDELLTMLKDRHQGAVAVVTIEETQPAAAEAD